MLWEDNYIAHFGIKGQKWGVRRYQNPDGTLTEAGKAHYAVDTGGNERLSKKYYKEAKKLKKLNDKADLNLQKTNAEKYNNRAKKAAKVGLAGLATAGTLVGLDIPITKAYNDASFKIFKYSGMMTRNADRLEKKLGMEPHIAERHNIDATRIAGAEMARSGEKIDRINKVRSMTTGVVGTTGAAVGLAGAGVAGVSKAKAMVAKRRTTEKGHAKAVAKREAQFNKMMNTFAGTPYADLLKRQNGR